MSNYEDRARSAYLVQVEALKHAAQRCQQAWSTWTDAVAADLQAGGVVATAEDQAQGLGPINDPLYAAALDLRVPAVEQWCRGTEEALVRWGK